MGEGRISEYLDWWKMLRKTATKIINFCKNRLQVDLNSQDIDRRIELEGEEKMVAHELSL